MKKMSYVLVLFAFTFFGCSKPDTTEVLNPSMHQISPLRAKMGDIIQISGSNLSSVVQINFEYLNTDLGYDEIEIYHADFISRTDTSIELRVPNVFHEDMKVKIVRQDTGINMKVVGFIPIPNNISIEERQVVSDNISVVRDNHSLYKSVNGSYRWEKIYDAPSGYFITSSFFLDEMHAWVGIGGNNGIYLYYSSDGGNTFNLQFQVHSSGGFNSIRKIQFLTPSEGFFVDGEGTIYKTDNNTFDDVYNIYPDLNTLSIGRVEIYDFTAVTSDLLFLSPNSSPNIIKLENQNASFQSLAFQPSRPQFFGSIGFLQSNSDIYKSTDNGESWNLIKTFENYYPRLQFFDANTGLAQVNETPFSIYKTVDGGVTWHKYWTPDTNTYYNTINTTVDPKHIWLFSDLWKYIEE